MSYRLRANNKLRPRHAHTAASGDLREPSPQGLAELGPSKTAPGGEGWVGAALDTTPGAPLDHRGERVPDRVRRRYSTNGAAA